MKVEFKVSVVVPVYNPGANIDGLISSLENQTLGPDDLEVVFVDDGSTDGTLERLFELAHARPNVLVTAIPNSGWPGRPRNVGTDLAHGEYVFYADHDDELFPEALKRMYGMAIAERSDIVYGKVVRVGRPTPYWSLAQRNISKADVTVALASRTVHKLYRREFLHEHQIRFPEGRVRLEDHNFMAQAISRAQVISVLADYPCYRWIHRPDGTNSSDAEVDQLAYWEYYTGVLRRMEASAGPGPLLDATRVIAMEQAFSRIPPRSYLQWDLPDRATTFGALHQLVLEQFPPELDGRIPVLKRLRVQALRSGELTRFEQLQLRRSQMSFDLGCAQFSWADGRVLVGVDAWLVSADGDPLAMDQVGDDVALPADLGAATGPGSAPCVLSTTERGTGEITVRHRQSGVEWPVDSIGHPKSPQVDTQATLGVHIDGTVDPALGAFGRELALGIWDVLVRVQFLGENQVRRLPVDAETPVPPAAQQVRGRKVLVYRTESGTLALRISASPVVLTASWEADHLVVALADPLSGKGSQLVVRQRAAGTEQQVVVQDGLARIVLGPTVPGDIFDFYLRTGGDPDEFQDQRLAFGAAQVSQQPPYRIYATGHGSFSVKHVQRSGPAPRLATQRRSS